MRRRHPRLWLMTDERADAGLLAAVARLPRGAGIVFRHRATPAAARRRRYEEVRRLARARGLVLVLAGPPLLAQAWRADGAHGAPTRVDRGRRLLRTAAAHDAVELVRARRADLVFLSPLFATRSHPGAHPLGRVRFARLARASQVPVIALGGVTHARGLAALGARGRAAIDAWTDPSRAVSLRRNG